MLVAHRVDTVVSTMSIADRLTPQTDVYESQQQGTSATSYIIVALGACFTVPFIVYMIYIVFKNRRRRGYIDIDKTIASIETASPRASESQDADNYFSTSTEESEKSSGEESKPVSFYIQVDSDEELTSSHFVKSSYLPKVHGPRRQRTRNPSVRVILSI